MRSVDAARGSVVLVHGLGHDRTQLDPLTAVIAGWRTITYDAHPPSADPAGHDLAALVADLERRLADVDTGPPLVTGGVSMGAAVTLHHALAGRGTPPDALVQIAPALGPTGLSPEVAGYLDWLASALDAGGFEGLRHVLREADLPRRDRDGQLAAVDGWERRFAPDVLVAAWRGFPASVRPLDPAVLAGLAVPLLVVAWAGDSFHPLATAEAYAAAAPRAELVVIDPPRDDHLPDAAGDALAAFLSALPPPRR